MQCKKWPWTLEFTHPGPCLANWLLCTPPFTTMVGLLRLSPPYWLAGHTGHIVQQWPCKGFLVWWHTTILLNWCLLVIAMHTLFSLSWWGSCGTCMLLDWYHMGPAGRRIMDIKVREELMGRHSVYPKQCRCREWPSRNMHVIPIRVTVTVYSQWTQSSQVAIKLKAILQCH